MLDAKRYNQEIRKFDDDRIYFIHDYTTNSVSMYEYIVNAYPVPVNTSIGPRSSILCPSGVSSNIATSFSEVVVLNPTMTSFTIDFWVNYSSTYTQTYPPIIISETPGISLPTSVFVLGPINSSGVKDGSMACFFAGITFSPAVQGSPPTWRHVAYVVNGSAVSCYVDGVQWTSTTGSFTTPTWTSANKYIQIRSNGGNQFANIRIKSGTAVPPVENDPVVDATTLCLIKAHVTQNTPIPNKVSIYEQAVNDITNDVSTSKSHSFSGWCVVPKNFTTINTYPVTSLNCRIAIGTPFTPTSLNDVMFTASGTSLVTGTYPFPYTSNITLPVNFIQDVQKTTGALMVKNIQFNGSNVSRTDLRSCAVPYKFKIDKNGQSLLIDTRSGIYTYTPNGLTRDGIFITSNAISRNSSFGTAFGKTAAGTNLADVNAPGSNILCHILQDALTLQTCAFDASNRFVLLSGPGKQTVPKTPMYITSNTVTRKSFDIRQGTVYTTDGLLNDITFRAIQ